jgi:hypothetical protein
MCVICVSLILPALSRLSTTWTLAPGPQSRRTGPKGRLIEVHQMQIAWTVNECFLWPCGGQVALQGIHHARLGKIRRRFFWGHERRCPKIANGITQLDPAGWSVDQRPFLAVPIGIGCIAVLLRNEKDLVTFTNDAQISFKFGYQTSIQVLW